MLRYLAEHPQEYPDLNVKLDFSKKDSQKIFTKIRDYQNAISAEEFAVFAGTDVADWFYQIGIPNNPDALYKELIKRSILRKARDDNRDDILNVCLEEQDIPESNETQTVLTDWFESADIPDIAIKLGELNTQKAESDKKILKCCRGGLMSMIKPFDLEHESVEDEKYIINGVMMERNIGNVIGASKQGKSYFIEEMLFCIENGLPWAGREVTQQHCVLIDFELTKFKLKTRYQKLLDKYARLYPDREFRRFTIVPMIEYWGRSSITLDTIIAWIQEYVSSNPDTKVIALDPFYRWFDGENENDNTEVRKCLEKFIPLKNDGLTFIYAHHTCKGGRNDNPLESGCGASCHGRVVDFALGLKGSNEKGFNVILRGREDNTEITMRRDSYGFFQYDATADSEIVVTDTQKQQLIKWLNRQEKQLKSIPSEIGKFTSSMLKKAGFEVRKDGSNIKVRSRLTELTESDSKV